MPRLPQRWWPSPPPIVRRRPGLGSSSKENLELIEEVTANSDDIAEGESVYVRDGTEDGTKGLTEQFKIYSRTWDGGIRQFLVDEQCDPEVIERVMADEMKRVL